MTSVVLPSNLGSRPSLLPKAFSWLLTALLALVVMLPGCQNYDQLVALDETCNQKWSDYEAALQRRADLIPNLVATVKGSAKFEEETLTKVTEARASATQIKLTADDLTDPAKVDAFNKAQDQLKGSLSRLMMTTENYPQLKASAQFQDLSKQIEGSENRLLRSREEYNKAVGSYNTELRKIRGSAINKATGKPFKERAYFKASEESKVAPKVSF